MWKIAKNPLQVMIVDNSVMSHNEAIEGLSIELEESNALYQFYGLLINYLMI